MARIVLTGGIACGKSLVAQYLNELGVETLDADDIVHELIPDPAERKRLAAEVFADPEKRRALEAKIHPQVRARLDEFLQPSTSRLQPPTFNLQPPTSNLQPPTCDARKRVAIVPLLFEVHWEKDFDIISCVTSERATQVERMMTTRGYSRAEAEARLAAQLPVAEKAARSHYVIANDGTPDELKSRVASFVNWLGERTAQER